MIQDRFKAQINYRTPTMYVKGTHKTPLAAAKELLLVMSSTDIFHLKKEMDKFYFYDDDAPSRKPPEPKP